MALVRSDPFRDVDRLFQQLWAGQQRGPQPMAAFLAELGACSRRRPAGGTRHGATLPGRWSLPIQVVSGTAEHRREKVQGEGNAWSARR